MILFKILIAVINDTMVLHTCKSYDFNIHKRNESTYLAYLPVLLFSLLPAVW